MKNVKMAWGLCALVALGVSANQASALTVNYWGQVTDWGVTPFSNTIPSDITGVNGNNTSPITYPHGVGAQPSPGGSTGEKFDLEGLYSYRDGNQVKVLLVASSGFTATANNVTFNLGDLLIDVDHDGGFDLGVVTQYANEHLQAGGLYEINDTAGLQHKSGSYYNYAPVADAIGAWAVKSGTLLGQEDIDTLKHYYSGEGYTWLYEYTFTLDEELQYHDLYMQLAWGCGNDMIALTLAAEDRPVIPPPHTPPGSPTPEPATAVLGLMSLGGLALAARRRKA
jgi:MYXO-CTERM domain-containing protein